MPATHNQLSMGCLSFSYQAVQIDCQVAVMSDSPGWRVELNPVALLFIYFFTVTSGARQDRTMLRQIFLAVRMSLSVSASFPLPQLSINGCRNAFKSSVCVSIFVPALQLITPDCVSSAKTSLPVKHHRGNTSVIII